MWKRRRSTDKRYPGDNRLILPKSPYRRQGLAPQHLGCASRNAGLVSAYNGEPRNCRTSVQWATPWEVCRKRSAQSSSAPAWVPGRGAARPTPLSSSSFEEGGVSEQRIQASASDPVTTEFSRTRWWPLAYRSNLWSPQHADPSPLAGQGEDIVCAAGNSGYTCDVGSSHPGAGVGPKGWAVRPLKRYASWV